MDIKEMNYMQSFYNSNLSNSKDNLSTKFLNKKHSLTFKPIFKSTSSLPIIESKSTADINSDENEKSDIRQGRWLQSEHFRFLKGCLLYGNNWGEIKKCIKTRSSAQIRSHAQKYLIKLSKKYRHHPKFSTQSKNISDDDLIIKEDYILEDYEIFPNEKIRELQIFAGIIPYDSIFEEKNNLRLNKQNSESKNIFSIEKIESSILGIFKFTGSKNLSDLDLVENLQPRYLTLSNSELKNLENLGVEDLSLQIKKRRSSLKLNKRKISNFNTDKEGINLNENINSTSLRIVNKFNSNKSSEDSLRSFKSSANLDIKQTSSNFQMSTYFSNFDEYMMNCYLQDQYIKKLVKDHIDNSISKELIQKEELVIENSENNISEDILNLKNEKKLKEIQLLFNSYNISLNDLENFLINKK